MFDFIVITGMPGAGKTTLIKELSKQVSFELLTLGSDKLPGGYDLDSFYAGARKATMAMLPMLDFSKTIICDRFTIDELIFGKLNKRDTDFSSLESDLNDFHSRYKVCYIVCYCDYLTYCSRLLPNKKAYSNEDFVELACLYANAINSILYKPTIVLDQTNICTAATLAEIKTLLK